MSNHIGAKVLAAAAMIVAMPALARAQSAAYNTTSPVAITSFSVDESYAPGTAGGDVSEAPQFIVSGITLMFVNKNSVPATTVKFSVNNGQYTQSIVDKGTFTPGVQIKHNFAVESGISPLSNTTCKVTEVDFADGSAWHIGTGAVANG